MKGDGTVYKRGNVWWIKFYRDGRAISMSAETTVKEVAKNRLREEVGKARTSQWLDPKARQVTVGDLIADLLLWYGTNNFGKMKHQCLSAWELHMKSHFEHVRADAFGTEKQRTYRAVRGEQGAAPATINRELNFVRKAFKIAFRAEPPKVLRVPYFEIVQVDNARKVFLDEVTMDKMRRAAAEMGLWQRVAVEIAFTYGWRKSDLFRLRVKDVNLSQRLLRLETSKNKEPREVPIPENLLVLLQAHVMGMKPDQKLMPFSPSHFAITWAEICGRAGVAAGRKNGFILHDARRSSARNKSAAGVSTRVIMQMQGWKTEAMFRRYAIVDQTDMQRALEMEQQKREEALKTQSDFEQLQHSYKHPLPRA